MAVGGADATNPLKKAEGLLELGAHGIHELERILLDDFFAESIPEIFLRIEFRRIGRKILERDVVGNGKTAAPVVGRAGANRQGAIAA
jgi:hypothetical protein